MLFIRFRQVGLWELTIQQYKIYENFKLQQNTKILFLPLKQYRYVQD